MQTLTVVQIVLFVVNDNKNVINTKLKQPNFVEFFIRASLSIIIIIIIIMTQLKNDIILFVKCLIVANITE